MEDECGENTKKTLDDVTFGSPAHGADNGDELHDIPEIKNDGAL